MPSVALAMQSAASAPWQSASFTNFLQISSITGPPLPPTRISLTRISGSPTQVGTLPEMEPHMPSPIHMPFSTASIFCKTSLPFPMRVAPRTGLSICPFFTRYPSCTAKLNSPVSGSTLPPPIFLAYRPLCMPAMTFSSSPSAIKVFVIRLVGAYR